jgi:hypothetical protein
MITAMEYEFLTPQAVELAIRARASYLARHTEYDASDLRGYASLTVSVGVHLDDALDTLRQLGIQKAFMWATTAGLPRTPEEARRGRSST